MLSKQEVLKRQEEALERDKKIEKEYDKTGGSIVPDKLESEAIRKFMNKETETLDYGEELTRRIIGAHKERKLSSKGESYV